MMANYLQLDSDEKVLLTSHLHWIHLFPVVVSTLLIMSTVTYALGWITANQGLLPRFVPPALVVSALLLLSLLSIIVLVAAYFIYRQNRILLTNRHLLQISQIGLFSRTVSKLTLDEIQDVRGTKNGFWATVLNYGEILVETAGSEPNFFFRPVADSLNLAESINDAHQEYGRRKA